MPTLGQSLGPALFIVVEGQDGTGTTTVTGALADALRARDLRVRTTAEPTDGPFGRLLRRHLRGEITLERTATALLFSADRADHLAQVVRPALGRGRIVISDRYLLSTLAYQGLEGVRREAVLAASAAFEVPDLTFLLRAPLDVRMERVAVRGAPERYEEPGFAERLDDAYDASVEVLRGAGHAIEDIDATQPPEAVVAEIVARLDARTP